MEAQLPASGQVVYAFVPVGRCPGDQDTVHIRTGRKAGRGEWRRGHHGLNSVDITLMEVRVRDARETMSDLVEILRGNVLFGKPPRRLGGWHEGRLMEATGLGAYWWRSTYSMRELRTIFRSIAWELDGRVGPAPGSGTAAEASEAAAAEEADPPCGVKRLCIGNGGRSGEA